MLLLLINIIICVVDERILVDFVLVSFIFGFVISNVLFFIGLYWLSKIGGLFVLFMMMILNFRFEFCVVIVVSIFFRSVWLGLCV